MTSSLHSSFHALSVDVPTPADQAHQQEERLLVAIDFGTTHSAVAWAHTATPDEYEVITHWPGNGKESDKVLSDISYTRRSSSTSPASIVAPSPQTPNSLSPASPAENSNEQRPDSFMSTISAVTDATMVPRFAVEQQLQKSRGYKWGFEVDHNDKNRLSYIKILLDTSQPRPDFVEPQRTILPKGKTPSSIVTDYLSALRAHALLTISRRLGSSVVSSLPISYVLTVPAVWSDKARALTVSSAEAAGITPVRLLSEPECALEFSLRTLRPSTLAPGSCFTVVDCGGGTCDLITVRLTSLSPLTLEEAAVGTGGLCGACYLDRRFISYLSSRLAPHSFADLTPPARFQLLDHWETHIKRSFTPEGYYSLPVIGLPDVVPTGFLPLLPQDIVDLFAPLITKIHSLIKSQLEASPHPVSAVLLVGGFGSSPYLYSTLSSLLPSSIPLLQPRNAWTSVVRGALIQAVTSYSSSPVTHRLSRRCYGVVHDSRFDPTFHDPREKVFHELRKEWVVKNRMRWYIRRGDVIREGEELKFPFFRTVRPKEVIDGKHKLKTELWVWEGEGNPPGKRGGRKDHGDSSSSSNGGENKVRRLARMRSSEVDVNKFRWVQSAEGERGEDGKGYWRADYELCMRVVGGRVVYEMKLDSGEKVGSVEVNYE